MSSSQDDSASSSETGVSADPGKADRRASEARPLPDETSHALWTPSPLARRTFLVLAGLAGAGLITCVLGRLISVLNDQHTRYTYRDQSQEIEALAWSPNSQRVASGAENLQVWSALSGALRQIYPALLGVKAVAWSPDGAYLACGNGDGTATVWEMATGKQLLTYRGHVQNQPSPEVSGAKAALGQPSSTHHTPHLAAARGVYDLGWSPDGTRLLSSGPDDTVQVWEAFSGHTLLTLGSRGAGFVGNAVWSPDGRQIAGYVFGGVRLWDAPSGVQLSTSWKIPSESPETPGALLSLAWSPNGQYLAAALDLFSSGNQPVYVWEAATGRNRQTYQGHTGTVLVVGWSPDSRRLASAGLDMTVRVWEATTGQTEYIYRGHMGFWQQYFSARAPQAPAQASRIRLAASRAHGGSLARSASLLRPQDTSQPHPLISALSWSPDGHSIASGGLDEDMRATVQVWQPE